MFSTTHVIKNPAGTYSYVGAVPGALAEIVPATYTDIIGGRAFSRDGQTVAYHFQPRQSIQAAVDEAIAAGAPLCDLASCACRRLFT